MCVVSLQKCFRMNFAVSLNCMALWNDGKWKRVKDAYPKQKCKFFTKQKYRFIVDVQKKFQCAGYGMLFMSWRLEIKCH